MITEFGHFALILGLGVALVQMILPAVGAWRGWRSWMRVAEPAALAQLLLVGAAFLALTVAFVADDFSLRIVFANSHTTKPLLYKIAGVWGNHEGSMLLWLTILTLFGVAAAVFGGGLPLRLRALVLSVQASIGVAFYLFILFTSNPFLRLAEPPLNGQDMNPLLQDPGLAFHPPFLYLGYVGLSMAFSFAVAALLEGRVDAAWARWVRPWTLAAWIFLTIGIALGSWWAYYELGWGGFWFWDPVENASFMPWLLATALLHSAIVAEKREALKSWTILLAILAFSFSLIGTFLVRSDLITSVHSFASDPTRGAAILVILAIFLGGSLTLYAARAGTMEARGAFAVVSRESALVLNNILLAVSAAVILVGTLWPAIASMVWGRDLSVGPPFFNKAFTPFMVTLALILPFGAMLAWKRGNLARVARALIVPAIFALAVGGLAFALQTGRGALGPVGMALGVWLVGGAKYDLWTRAGHQPARLFRLPRADWGRAIAHGGLGVSIIGIACLTAWTKEIVTTVPLGGTFDLGQYQVELVGIARERGPNYVADRAEMTVRKDGRTIATLWPEKRFYTIAGMPTTEAAIRTGALGDIYLVIGDAQPDESYAVRGYVKPFTLWIWLGAGMMALGGAFSLSDRRLRVAAGAARTADAKVAAE